MRYKVYIGDRCIADKVEEAADFMSRLRGLMLRKSLPEGGGLLLRNCGAIHCCFMRFTIDVVYLDKQMKVIDKETVRPWCIGKIVKGAKHVLELAEGQAETVEIGGYIRMEENT